MNWVRKIGILDLVIIIFVIVLLLLLGNYLFSKIGLKNNMERISYKLEITGAETQLVEELTKGKDIFNRGKNYYMGEIIKVETNPHKEEHKDLERGIINLVDHPEKSNILLDIEVDGRTVNGISVLEGEELRIGLETDIRGKSFDCIGTIISIEREKNGEKTKLGRLWHYISHNDSNHNFEF